PRLVSETKGNQMTLRWEVPQNLPFPMPVEVELGKSIKRFEMPAGAVSIPVGSETTVVLDPQNWILKSQ
ncbi:MAG TPA: hypothetical protein VFH31_06700, partial [Pyrinomonadaceae bacterium]|nr:hypothetical protein [Pyrinomonadaceae bacterium]